MGEKYKLSNAKVKTRRACLREIIPGLFHQPIQALQQALHFGSIGCFLLGQRVIDLVQAVFKPVISSLGATRGPSLCLGYDGRRSG
jgi:hypothetical protein